MKFGQFCGILADELEFHHSSFLLCAELMFSSDEAHDETEMPFTLPQRTVTTRDAAMLLCLAAAMDGSSSEPSEIAEYAMDVIGAGDNLSKVIEGIETARGVTLSLAGHFDLRITIPPSLVEKISPLVKGGAVSHLRSV